MGEGQSSSSIDRIVIIDTPDVNLAFNDEEHERLLDKDNVTEEIIEESSPQLIVNDSEEEAHTINISNERDERDILMENAVT